MNWKYSEEAQHVWSYDFVHHAIHDGRSLQLLTLIDEFSRACLTIRVARRLWDFNVIEALAVAMVGHGAPDHPRSDNGLIANAFFGPARGVLYIVTKRIGY